MKRLYIYLSFFMEKRCVTIDASQKALFLWEKKLSGCLKKTET